LVGNLPAGVFFVQAPHGRPVLVNARARQLLGREETAAGLAQLPEVYHLHRPDGTPYPAQELPVYRALHEGRPAMRDDIVVHRPDGRRVPLVGWAAPVHLRGGAGEGGPGAPRGPDAAVWVLEDLTALRQAEADRSDLEGRLRTVVATMAEGLLVHDAAGAVTDGNPTAGALLGEPPQRLRGRALAELVGAFVREDGTPLPGAEYPADVVLRTGRPVRNCVLGIAAPGAAAGECRWVVVNALPLEGGGVVTTLADVTEGLRAQRQLRAATQEREQEEARYRRLVESLPLVVLLTDEHFRVVYANPALKEMSGYELDEVAEPEAWARAVHPDDVPRLLALAAGVLEGRPGRAEFRYRAKDGGEKVGFAMSQPRREGGRVVGALTLVVDMTRERQLERELQRAQRLDLVGRLAGGIAHDFNNLLAAILGLSDLAVSELPGGHPVRDDLRGIHDAALQAAALAAQLLAFGKPRPAPDRAVDLNAVVRRALQMLRGSLPPEVHVEPDLAGPELRVRADETQLQQVLMNLCLNARDAMPEGGRLRVRTAAAPDGGRDGVRLSVEDEGVGMSEAVLARVFEPFFSTKERGTGLGLAVVRQIVEGHGGRVEVASRPGRGSRFDVWWPAG
jgi:PAS domain S-box-containing protein